MSNPTVDLAGNKESVLSETSNWISDAIRACVVMSYLISWIDGPTGVEPLLRVDLGCLSS